MIVIYLIDVMLLIVLLTSVFSLLGIPVDGLRSAPSVFGDEVLLSANAKVITMSIKMT